MTADAASAHVDSLNADSEIAAGTSQTVTAQVRDVHGNVLGAGVTVNWDVTGGTLSAATSTTNAAGVASTQVTAPTSTGSLSVSAYVQPADTPEVANLTVTPDFESRRVVAVQTDTSTLTADGATQAPLQVWSQDQYGNPVPGDTIDIVSSKGALDLTEMTTDASGHAAAMYTVPRILWSIVDGMDSMTVSASSRGTAITVSDNLAVRQVLDVSQFSYDSATRTLSQNTGVPLTYTNRRATTNMGQGGTVYGTYIWEPEQTFGNYVGGAHTICRLEANGSRLTASDTSGTVSMSPATTGGACGL